jgi:hypothetical protein
MISHRNLILVVKYQISEQLWFACLGAARTQTRKSDIRNQQWLLQQRQTWTRPSHRLRRTAELTTCRGCCLRAGPCWPRRARHLTAICRWRARATVRGQCAAVASLILYQHHPRAQPALRPHRCHRQSPLRIHLPCLRRRKSRHSRPWSCGAGTADGS